jgi:hypothetical protein
VTNLEANEYAGRIVSNALTAQHLSFLAEGKSGLQQKFEALMVAQGLTPRHPSTLPMSQWIRRMPRATPHFSPHPPL